MIQEEERNRAFHMKQEGFSVSDISKSLSISKNTLYKWFSQGVSPETIERVVFSKKERIERLKNINEARREKLDRYYQRAKEEARSEFLVFSKDPLFIAGMTAYWVGGDRVSKYNLRMGNSDPGVLLVFANFLTRFLAVQRKSLKAQVFFDNSINPDICLEFWAINLKLERDQFMESILLNRGRKTKKSRYGNCNIGITSRFLKTKMLEWITIFDREMRS